MPALIPDGQRQAIVFDAEPLEQFDKLKNLANGNIDIARSVFSRLQPWLWSPNEIPSSLKENVYQKAVYFVLLYGCESSIKGYLKCSTTTVSVAFYT